MLNQLFSVKYLQKVAFYLSEQKNYPTVVEERKESKEENEIVVIVLCVC